MRESKMCCVIIIGVIIFDSIPLLYNYPININYISENPLDEGTITITYQSRKQYFIERVFPISVFSICIMGLIYLIDFMFGGKKDEYGRA